MTIGTFVISAILIAIVAAIIVSMVRSHRAGKHVGCDGCNACGGVPSAAHGAHHGSQGCGCANVEQMIEHMNDQVK